MERIEKAVRREEFCRIGRFGVFDAVPLWR